MRDGSAGSLVAITIACGIAAGGCGLDENAGGDAGPGCDGTCAGSTTARCDDGVRNGDETGVDCGGSCPRCQDGAGCRISADCVDDTCKGGMCGPAACVDGIKDQDESDVDCGGICKGCTAGRICRGDADCYTGFC